MSGKSRKSGPTAIILASLLKEHYLELTVCEASHPSSCEVSVPINSMVDSEIEICHTEVTSTLLHKRDDSQSYDGDKYYNNCESMPGSRHTKRQFCLCFVGLIAPVLTFVWGWELSRYHYWGLYVRRLPGDYAFGPST